MDSSLATSHDSSSSSKKTRATSCTACRQVKLKCDLKERYPNPCSRCLANRQNCRTDASFKRIPARSRIRDLESQIDRLKRARALKDASPPTPPVDPAVNLERQESYDLSTERGLDIDHLSLGPSSTSPAGSDCSRAVGKWLNITESEEPASFALYDISLPYRDSLELFYCFEELFLPHFSILESVSSLSQLREESRLLFWTIILVTSRVHTRHSTRYKQIENAQGRLFAEVTQRAVNSLLDLHAVLILCVWPCPMQDKLHDPSWMRIGLAINAARQMGLDQLKDEGILGTRGPKRSMGQHSTYAQQATWMKCLELEAQMSCWHGQLPSLTSPRNLRSAANFCNTSPSSCENAALMSIHVELAQSSMALDDGLNDVSQIQPYMARMACQRLNAAKAKWCAAWTLDTEIEFLIAKLYLFSFCLVRLKNGDSRTVRDTFVAELLEASRSNAIQMVDIVTHLSADAQASLPSAEIHTELFPLPGSPDHHSRSVFFAAIVLLNYLDVKQGLSDEFSEPARNAYSRAYQFFARRDSSDRVSRTLEVLGRGIIQGRARLRPHVATRMGASLMYDALVLANQLLEQERPAVVAATTSRASSEPQATSSLDERRLHEPQPQQAYLEPNFSSIIGQPPTQGTFGLEYNPEAWNHAALDAWALATAQAGVPGLDATFEPLAFYMP